ncbi:pentapeptide repeat-containing protein [Chrysosporum ovalisporum APH033B]|uniref:pentapeptide repeat-containing protein n=1 Tax=Umezakia ovalisporum TaxID=75695 RepID=UPI0024762095|nr:pentapeptide repeat-containing protein [Umezakia ovalisporum]MDH6065969.1 pentapeptide repeat-containing protein [Umezakia ovalisporum APH033B]
MLMAIINTYQTLKRQLTSSPMFLPVNIFGKLFTPWIFVNNRFQWLHNCLITLQQELNNQNPNKRAAAIYDLEQFAQNYSQSHWEVMTILSHFVQNHAAYVNKNPLNPNPSSPIPTDVQVALTVIGRRDTNHDKEDEQLDLSHTDMRGANLAGANLKLTNLYQVNLVGANLAGANLAGAVLSAANLAGANLAGADLSQAILSAANLCGANLTGANLQRASLYLANLQGATVVDAMFDKANLREAFWMIQNLPHE